MSPTETWRNEVVSKSGACSLCVRDSRLSPIHPNHVLALGSTPGLPIHAQAHLEPGQRYEGTLRGLGANLLGQAGARVLVDHRTAIISQYSTYNIGPLEVPNPSCRCCSNELARALGVHDAREVDLDLRPLKPVVNITRYSEGSAGMRMLGIGQKHELNWNGV